MCKRSILIILCCVFILTLAGCSQSSKMANITEEEVTELQLPVLKFIASDGVFNTNGCYTNVNDEGLATMYIDAYEVEGVDYESYKEVIWDGVGAVFNIEYEIIPFPEEPRLVGVIRKKEIGNNSHNLEDFLGNVLVVAMESDWVAADGYPYYDASTISVVESCEIVDQSGNPLTFDDLEVGMEVSSYNRGMVLTTYPGQESSEKLVVNTDYEMPIVSNDLTEAELEEKFGGKDYTGPYPVIVEGYRFDGDLPMMDGSVVFYMQSGMVYYDIGSKLIEPMVYEGTLDITIFGANDVYVTDKIENVLLEPDFNIELVYHEDIQQTEFWLPLYRDGKLVKTKYYIDELGEITEAIEDEEAALGVPEPVINQVIATGWISNYKVALIMTSGIYYFDENPGAYYGENWEGHCALELFKDEELIHTYPLQDWKQSLNFHNGFELEMTDMGDDGIYDFFLGQYFSSNINIYRMYQIVDDEIKNIESINAINVSDAHPYTLTLVEDQQGIYPFSFYNNAIGDYVDCYLTVDGESVDLYTQQ